MFATASKYSSSSKRSFNCQSITFSVPQVPLQKLLDKHSISDAIVLSIDVEGAEMEVLESIDFDRSTFKCILVENNHSSWFGSREIRAFLASKGYIYYARFWQLDDVFLHCSYLQ